MRSWGRGAYEPLHDRLGCPTVTREGTTVTREGANRYWGGGAVTVKKEHAFSCHGGSLEGLSDSPGALPWIRGRST